MTQSKTPLENNGLEANQVIGNDFSGAAFDWAAELEAQAYAFGEPALKGTLKAKPEDFIVTELMDVEPTGEGEHTWLDITKVRCNTDAVAKALARFAGVAYRDVAYSGMKDFQAVTRQWFSVWRPKGDVLDWSDFSLNGIEIHRVVKHSRKLKRGTHRANEFRIRLSSLSMLGSAQFETSSDAIEAFLEHRLNQLKQAGVPNYFGDQRFGRNVNNMPQAVAMLLNDKRIKDRNLRGLLLSSARSWLFNQCVSARVKAGSWQSLFIGEPANLNGSNSVFTSTNSVDEGERLNQLDIHPTAPLWGDNADKAMSECPGLFDFEKSVLIDYQPLLSALERARLDYQRRPLRSVPDKLNWAFERDESGQVHGLVICFELQSGQFATSLIRELILAN